MKATQKKKRRQNKDVLVMILTGAEYFASLHFEAYELPNGHFELTASETAWDHAGYDTMEQAQEALEERAKQLGIPKKRCDTRLRIKCDPLRKHQILIRHWNGVGLTEMLLHKNTQFDGQRATKLSTSS